MCAAALGCVLTVAACLGGEDQCPQGSITANPATIPEGLSETELLVDVHIPYVVDGYVAVTELSAISGTIADPFARATTYACAHDVSGPVEVCVTTIYVDPDPLECSTLSCTVVTCPEDKNECPEVSSLTIDPMPPTIVPEGGTATITIVADDPDDTPTPP